MSTAVKRMLSGSTDGMAIKITAITTPGNLIHTARLGSIDGTWDEVWLWAYNYSLVDRGLCLEWGSELAIDNILIVVPSLVGLVPLTPGLILRNSKVIRAYAADADSLTVVGFVNQIQDGWEIDR
jgi:hypothetical protein